MTTAISRCVEHGDYAEETCPHCGETGERLLSGPRREQLSRFVSGALRHFPDDAGLALDGAGWTPWTALVDSVEHRYDWAGERELNAVVATDPKGRFETGWRGEEREIRAAYGHSVDVDLDADSAMASTGLPKTLYHGTAPRNVDAILREGLKPMNRQSVHLSGTRETAHDVGTRHTAGDAEPLVFRVDVRALVDAGFTVQKRGTDTYTVTTVPPRFLSLDEDGGDDGRRSPDV